MKVKIIICSIVMTALGYSSCKKFVNVPPPITSISDGTTFASDATANAVLDGIYSKMLASHGFASGGQGSVTFQSELSADNLNNFPQSASSSSSFFYGNALTSTGNQPAGLWSEIYSYIYMANAAIEGLTNNTSVTPTIATQLTGEAKFVRAFCYFYLTNLFGDVPLITSTDYPAASAASRTAQSKVYDQIVSDLTDAQTTLRTDYSLSATNERIRPNKWAATAMLARVYLYLGRYTDAETQASSVISNTLFSLPTPATAFLKNSQETIWSLKPVLTNYNTDDGVSFGLPTNGPNTALNSVTLNSQLLSAFEPNDNRRLVWVDSVIVTNPAPAHTYYFAYKYKVINITTTTISEYSMVLRFGEQYLIRAEARAQQNNVSGAQSDLNAIRTRAGLPGTTAGTTADLLAAILRERRVELFTEWGHRWLDLKRTKSVDSVMSVATPAKGGTWNTNWQLYPIPHADIITDINLTQNLGYN